MFENYIAKTTQFKKNLLHRNINEYNSISPTEVLDKNGQKLISFACNDYLGLSHHKALKNAAIAAIKKYGVGARASRFITGNNSLYNQLEALIAEFYQTQDALVFSSGYSCAIGVVQALVGKNDLIIADKLIHACLLDAAILSQAKLIRFNHNDINHCRQIIAENRQNFQKCLIISETIFSMDGDVGKISELLELALEFDGLLLSDDAHGIGFQAIPSERHLQMGTLSKAFGGLGGFVAGHQTLIDFLRQFARSLKYSTALMPAVLASSIAAIQIAQKSNLYHKSLANAEYFCKLLEIPKPQSAIVVIILKNNKLVVDVAKKLLQEGFLVGAIRPPSVPANQARLRVTFSAAHKKSDIKKLVYALKKFLPKNEIF